MLIENAEESFNYTPRHLACKWLFGYFALKYKPKKPVFFPEKYYDETTSRQQ